MRLLDLWKAGQTALMKGASIATAGRTRGHRPPSGLPIWQRQPLVQGILYPDDNLLTFLEELRRTTPLVDRAQAALVQLCGKIEIEGSKTAARELTEWMERVPVNQLQNGFQSWLEGHLDSMLQYGKAVGEIVPARGQKDIYALTNLDPRSVLFKVTPDPLALDPYQRQGTVTEFRRLNRNTILVSLNGGHVDRPHGVSIYRATPFVSQCLRTVENACAQQWKRTGAPPFHLNWRPGPTFRDPNGTLAAEVRNELKAEWDDVMGARDPETNTIKDLITSGEITVTTIGADGMPAVITESARHFAEQIVAVTGLPPWMLGLSWTTTETMSSQQAELLVAQIEGIRRAVLPQIQQIIDTRQRFTGTRGAVTVKWSTVSLHDAVEQARAQSYKAQAEQAAIDNAFRLWEAGILNQQQAALRIDPSLDTVARAQAMPPAAAAPARPGESTAPDGGTRAAPPVVKPQFGEKPRQT
jgi:hypothetical protein